MSIFSDSTICITLALIGAGGAMSPTARGNSSVSERVVWSAPCESAVEAAEAAEWAELARSAPTSDEIRQIAKYLLETGQAAK